jgi:hypothetical protein
VVLRNTKNAEVNEKNKTYIKSLFKIVYSRKILNTLDICFSDFVLSSANLKKKKTSMKLCVLSVSFGLFSHCDSEKHPKYQLIKSECSITGFLLIVTSTNCCSKWSSIL